MQVKKSLLIHTSRIGLLLIGLMINQYGVADTSLHLDGQWQQGAILFGKVEPGTDVVFGGHKLSLTSAGNFVIGLGRDAAPVAILKTRVPGQPEQVHRFAVTARQYKVQRVNGVPAGTVNPPPEVMARIQKEQALVTQARKHESAREDFLQVFQWPLIGPITGVYGSQRIYNGVPKNPHFGVDVARPVGTEVVAPAGGEVVLAYPDMYFSGGTLIVDHGHGLYSSFIHLSKILVKAGDEIKQGQPIAQVGATGRASGPHLDWRMNWFEERVDPQLLVGPMPTTK